MCAPGAFILCNSWKEANHRLYGKSGPGSMEREIRLLNVAGPRASRSAQVRGFASRPQDGV